MKRTYSNHARFLVNNFSEATVGDIFGEDEPVTFEIYCGLKKPKPKLAPTRYSHIQISNNYRINYRSSNRTRYMTMRATTEQRAKDYFDAKYKKRQFISIQLI